MFACLFIGILIGIIFCFLCKLIKCVIAELKEKITIEIRHISNNQAGMFYKEVVSNDINQMKYGINCNKADLEHISNQNIYLRQDVDKLKDEIKILKEEKNDR